MNLPSIFLNTTFSIHDRSAVHRMPRIHRIHVCTALWLLGAGACSTARDDAGARDDSPPRASVAAASPQPLAPAPNSRWSLGFGTVLKLEGAGLPRTAELRLMIVGGVLKIHAVDLPLGTIIAIAGREQVVDAEHGVELELPIDVQLADEAWETLFGEKGRNVTRMPPKVDWKLPFTVTLPKHEPLQATLPKIQVGAGLEDVFVALATTPRTWPGESGPPAEAAPAAAAWTFNGFKALGTAARVKDVRMVVLGQAIANDKTRRCTGYAGAKDFTATSYDVTLDIVDRFANKSLASKRFAGRLACPRTVVLGPGVDAGHSEGPDGAAMEKWVVSQLGPLARSLRDPP